MSELKPATFKPLSAREKGRGFHISDDRRREIEGECLRLIRLGVKQNTIGQQIGGASSSRVSRWCQSAIRDAGDQTLHRHLEKRDRTSLQRLWARIDVQGKDDCWSWLGSTRPNGYGTPPDRTGEITAHRAVYAALISKIPDGMVVDHICRNPGCCNPRHLQLATQGENLYFVRVRRAS